MSLSKLPPDATDEQVINWITKQPCVRPIVDTFSNPQSVVFVILITLLFIGILVCFLTSHTLL
ncbi:hypothetical protein A2239_01095 [Candidatus Uhrbacteria bacterium RIFOXYA2_FULL_40_9]|nr:MAG: hypothetical protein A2239_01095 [Candidatus Uhrbacteria bacterium RIFOXYA2_FULL_40_9]OGL97432.1 MAG: hypothetical protein A2332_01220 [Candidatus Uhrbacteria bacterium RIFOXYB2_FULL_41_18]HBK34800.1 hypothetical protein [Candidatus Uhrbacteria bacterium]HCB56124.1 hypothetical protein [Candidatus Uhrbacteria bacterium]